MRVSELGEFGLIERIAHLLPHAPSDVIVGIGDDVAVLRASAVEYLLATCDCQVENTHFARDAISPSKLGRKIAAINLSDIAAMGGIPCWALVSLCLPGETDVEFVDSLYLGMREQMELAGATIVGGNLSGIHSEIVIDLFLLGKVPADQVVLRRGAREGDLIMVTGTLGDSKAGLELIRHPGMDVAHEVRSYLQERHFTPQPRLREGRALGREGLAHAMVDISDGLMSDLGHICRESKVGARIRVESLPISDQCRTAAYSLKKDAWRWALTGGEDYELLFSIPPGSVQDVAKILTDEVGASSHVIGEIVAEGAGIVAIGPGGEELPYSGTKGWDHFS